MSLFCKMFLFFLFGFLAVYLMRGFGIFSWLPGGFILFLLLIAIASGLLWGIKATLRY